MDKKIWLEVIREELVLLDKLANGMIKADQLTKEEVELAISRSMVVAKEFEMLLSECQVPGSEARKPELAGSNAMVMQPETIMVPETPLAELSKEKVVATRQETVQISPKAEEIFESPIPYDLAASEGIVPEVKPIDDLLVFEHLPSAPLPLVPPSPRPPVSTAPPPYSEEQSAIDHEIKKEEHPLFKLTPINSLNEGMTLNDRYLFQKELFGNDKSRLDETIVDMDRLSNIHEAISYLKSHFKWMKGEASERFILLVKRRFYEPKG